MPSDPAKPADKAQKSDVASAAPGLGDILAKIVHEIVLARVRHRALLQTLMNETVFRWETYVDNYDTIRERDAAGLFAQLFMEPELFSQQFSEWKQADTQRYGYQPKRLREKAEQSQPNRMTKEDEKT
jgi:hypothetical protein